MIEKLIIAGAGGQGIMLLGKVLAQAVMQEFKYVTWLPSYGAEVRGGTAYCMVVISDTEIGSPYINPADTLIIMNAPSLERFKNWAKFKGLLIVNSSLARCNIDKPHSCTQGRGKKNLQILEYPFTDIAVKLGNIKVANMVALGCYLANRKIIELKNVFKVIEEIAPPDRKDLIEINKKALREGMKLK